MSMHEIPGVFSGAVEIRQPLVEFTSPYNPMDARNASFRAQAMPQNHSSRDRGVRPMNVSPTNRNRHGNKR